MATVCSKCGSTERYGKGRDRCAPCRREQTRRYRATKLAADPVAYRAKVREYNKNRPPGTAAGYRRKSRTGWSQASFIEAWRNQQGQCAICGISMIQGRNKGITAVHADHDHVRNKTRALLCAHCNKGLGHFFDNATTLRRAAHYIELWGG